MPKPFAVFDIDGTLIRWQLYHAIGDELARQGVISPQAFNKVRSARMGWKKRLNDQSFSEYEHALIQVFDKALTGLSVKDFTNAANAVFSEYKEQVYIYTRDLIKDLKSRGYLLFAVSGSPDIIVKKMASFYGFDGFAATDYPAKDGKFIGTKNLSLGRKGDLLKELVASQDSMWEGSLAVGDTESDIELLELVEQPIAFNPTSGLFNHARKMNWPVVLERKNVIYKLEASDGTYKLSS